MSKKRNAPPARRGPQMGADAPAEEVADGAKAMGEKIPRQARAESEAQAGRAEGHQVGNDLIAVVGVGASAGGLEAFRQLLKLLPVDTGMAFVLACTSTPSTRASCPICWRKPLCCR